MTDIISDYLALSWQPSTRKLFYFSDVTKTTIVRKRITTRISEEYYRKGIWNERVLYNDECELEKKLIAADLRGVLNNCTYYILNQV